MQLTSFDSQLACVAEFHRNATQLLSRVLLIAGSLGLVFTTAAVGLAADAVPAPNVVIISIDDLGYSDTGPFGSQTNSTPHLDRMAAEGRKMTSHYAAPICTPSRAALMTGCYPKRALPIPHVLFPDAIVGLNPEEVTVPEVLKEAGYATGCFGKWHLGDHPDFLPTRQGFDEYFGLLYSNDMGPLEDGTRNSLGKINPNQGKNANGSQDETGIRGNRQPPLLLIENETAIERVRAEQQFSLVRRYTERAQQFIKKHQNERFFVYLPHNAVHFPHYPSEPFQGKSKGATLGDWIEEIDWSVGQILDQLRELKLDEKTLVIFVSDNGGPLGQRATNHPFRGGKGATLEGGIRVPCIVRWPGKVPAGTSSNQITSMMDILPTLAALAGAAVPADRKIDGVNVWPAWSGEEGAAPRDHFFYFKAFQLEAVRKGPWKLHLLSGELYQLEQDPGEAQNVAVEHPDVVQQLRELGQSMEGDLGLTNIGPGCRPPGRVDRPHAWVSP